MALYTRRGDDGTTGLFGGRRVEKDDLRVHTYGEVDELNAALGLARAASGDDEMLALLSQLQAILFVVGSDLATPRDGDGDAAAAIERVGAQHVTLLEALIDDADGRSPALTTFILPGGGEVASRLHLARAVCRRAERACVALGRDTDTGEHVVPFLNRLSDLLFAAARWANRIDGVDDVPWNRGDRAGRGVEPKA